MSNSTGFQPKYSSCQTPALPGGSKCLMEKYSLTQAFWSRVGQRLLQINEKKSEKQKIKTMGINWWTKCVSLHTAYVGVHPRSHRPLNFANKRFNIIFSDSVPNPTKGYKYWYKCQNIELVQCSAEHCDPTVGTHPLIPILQLGPSGLVQPDRALWVETWPLQYVITGRPLPRQGTHTLDVEAIHQGCSQSNFVPPFT